jgi:hypothetical protein
MAAVAGVVAVVVVSLVTVLALPGGNPLRILAGLTLFVALPGLGLELGLLRPDPGARAWDRLAVIGAMGIAASGLASVFLAVIGLPIDEWTVGVACASIAVVGSISSLIPRVPRGRRLDQAGTFRIALLLMLIVIGGLIGSMIGASERTDTYTVLALEDPIEAEDAREEALADGGKTTVSIVVESHEVDPEEYQISVVGGPQSPLFTLRPSERRVLVMEVGSAVPGPVEIQLLRRGQPYRTLRLSGP